MDLLEWDARSYDALPLPHRHWGTDLLARLPLAGTETVLDLGCGTGRDTERLLAALPAGRVLALDGSRRMLAALGERLSGAGDRLTVLHADLREPLRLPERVDAAFSVATLHWLPDHDLVFHGVGAALRPGGRFVAEAGGRGNVAGVLRALAEVSGGTDEARFWNFSGVDDTVARLRGAGFTDIDVQLVPDPARLEPGEPLEAFLGTVVLGAHLRELPAERRRPFVRAVARRLPEPVVDYVRLRIDAVRR
ncbi:class I SAM-dependent methyltransferase [Plantactinospora soyae]|uniref:Trans-aconitate 2-methyltransferase n=1 Tax=Plantactinospora soyae TaxID=1544732 RepID=A0A927R512_9ACTN|nr:class I SAM-dependent methyltransferase [Plantactinospora soyae]MBE1485506.1 trans-aconitate 2-methyltransferase [Plantactinospora soyae]